MNKQKQHSGHRQLTQVLILQYILTLFGFVSLSAIGFIVIEVFIREQIWHGVELTYKIGKFVEQQSYLLFPAYVFIGWTMITFLFIRKTIRLMDSVTLAASQLASGDDQPVVLPKAVKYIEDKLNLLNERAIREGKIAKEAEQRKNDMIVYLAHDLKTPLTSVIGYLTLLRDEDEIAPHLRQKYTEIALNKSLRLEDLINAFFDITRLSLTHLTLNTEQVHITRMVEQIAFEFEPALHEKQLKWHLALEPDVHGTIDADKINRVLDNLIKNAINYSYVNTEIELFMHIVTPEVLTMHIKNQGKTIPPEKTARLFEPFFRMDMARSSDTGGAGLGLAISKEIIELHGGSIQVRSENETIEFVIELPLKKS